MYGMKQREASKNVPLGQEIVANSTVLAKDDPVTLDTDGFLILASAGLRIMGVMNEDYTAAADNETVAMYKAQFIEADMADLYEMDASTALSATHRGMYANVSGTTGAIVLDTSSVVDNAAQLRIRSLDPREENDELRALVNIAELEALAYTQD